MKEYRRVGAGYFHADEDIKKLVNEVLASDRISYGSKCRTLEEMFARAHSVKYAVTSSSGTDSLRAALHALKIIHDWSDGDEVLIPATTFVATANIVLQLNLVPVFVDVNPYHYTIDVSEIAGKVTDKTRAIIPVNLLGQAADLSGVAKIAEALDLHVVEDSCEAMFVAHRGFPVGSWGDIGCFSFYMAHLITAGVGGIAVTDNYDYADMMRSLLNHGRDTIYTSIDDSSVETDVELRRVVLRRFLFLNPGYSSRMTELQAALAIPQMIKREEMLASRRAVATALTSRLSRHPQLQLPYSMEGNQHSWMMYGITVRNEPKWDLMYHLETSGIETRELLPLIDQPVYADLRIDIDDYPVSKAVLNHSFYIGCHQGMTDDDVEYIGEVIDKYYGE